MDGSATVHRSQPSTTVLVHPDFGESPVGNLEVRISERLVVVGASAGGVEALRDIMRVLPTDLDCPVLVVVHIPAHFPSQLPAILGRVTTLDVAHATDGESLKNGTVRIAPPDTHLVVEPERIRLMRTPSENRHRPSIDVLFRTAALSHGDRVTAVVLSGGPGDGVVGARTVDECGGHVVVQEPTDAVIPALPESVLAVVNPHLVATAEAIGGFIGAFAEPQRAMELSRGREVAHAVHGDQREMTLPPAGWRPSSYACPDCTGVLWERDHATLIEFRCRIGHAYGSDALMDGKAEELESALWSAVNTMEERGELAARLSRRASDQTQDGAAGRFGQVADNMRRNATQIRELLRSWSDFRLEGVDRPAPHDQPEEVRP